MALAYGDGDKTKWESVSDRMEKHGSRRDRVPKASRKRSEDSRLERSPSSASEHEMPPYMQRTSKDATAWSDQRSSVDSGGHDTELRLMSALSSSTMDSVRNRSSGDTHHHHLQRNHQPRNDEATTPRYQLPSQSHSQHMTYDQAHHQRHPW